MARFIVTTAANVAAMWNRGEMEWGPYAMFLDRLGFTTQMHVVGTEVTTDDKVSVRGYSGIAWTIEGAPVAVASDTDMLTTAADAPVVVALGHGAREVTMPGEDVSKGFAQAAIEYVQTQAGRAHFRKFLHGM